MIALLTGRIDSLDATSCIIDVAGVGYLVQASTRTLAALPSAPTQARLLIETVVREDAILLYGFADSAERDWFRLLTTVQGVGAKVALAILSALTPAELVGAIASADRVSLTRVPGVGPKLAIRLLTELRDRAGAMPAASVPTPPEMPPRRPALPTTRSPPWQISATGDSKHTPLSAALSKPSAPRQPWTPSSAKACAISPDRK